ncbi:MAG: hypothetical protein SPJ89_11010 [Treponema sp.]|nr:hypothetical protein [Spirochaetia bacterium]MDD7459011.1 hypothetical protein [Spirochaetales bacterium]MDY5812495.1 hypothetical protein [Treponema sp.]
MKTIKKLLCLTVLFMGTVFAFSQNAFYIGDGGKDLSIEVGNPTLTNIGDDAAWIPSFVVNSLSDDIKKYSAITVIERRNLSQVTAANVADSSVLYDQNSTGELGGFTVAKNILVVEITGKPSSYMLSFSITDKSTAAKIASYNNPNCPYADLESGLVLKKAVADLLEQLKVSLTAEGKNSLLAVESSNASSSSVANLSIEAQKSVAKAEQARKKGSAVEAMSLLFEARSKDNTLARVTDEIKSTSNVLSSEDIGDRARNQIKLRKDFINLAKTVSDYYRQNPPLEFYYQEAFAHMQVNYDKNQIYLPFFVGIYCLADDKKIVDDIYENFEKQPDSRNWGIRNSLEADQLLFPDGNNTRYLLTFELLDSSKKII